MGRSSKFIASEVRLRSPSWKAWAFVLIALCPAFVGVDTATPSRDRLGTDHRAQGQRSDRQRPEAQCADRQRPENRCPEGQRPDRQRPDRLRTDGHHLSLRP